jgi:hypothetical protein
MPAPIEDLGAADSQLSGQYRWLRDRACVSLGVSHDEFYKLLVTDGRCVRSSSLFEVQ